MKIKPNTSLPTRTRHASNATHGKRRGETADKGLLGSPNIFEATSGEVPKPSRQLSADSQMKENPGENFCAIKLGHPTSEKKLPLGGSQNDHIRVLPPLGK